MKNSAKIYTNATGGSLNLSTSNTTKAVLATNNKAQYFAEQAKKYRDEAKYYSEQNSDVSPEDLETLRLNMLLQIDSKQPLGAYALKNELPQNLSELNNDTEYATESQVNAVLPSKADNNGKFLYTDGENVSWENISGYSLFDIKVVDRILVGTDAIGWALQGSLVTNTYPQAIAKIADLYAEATDTVFNGISCKLTADGRYVASIEHQSAINELYQAEGISEFYIYDSLNGQFYLPQPFNIANKYVYYRVGDTPVNNTLVDVGNVLSDLSEISVIKMNADHSNDNNVYLKEVFEKDGSFYRVWSDGFCVQGAKYFSEKSLAGNNTFTLLKEFADTTYCVFAQQAGKATSGGTPLYVMSESITTTSFVIDANSGWTGIYWQACGYLKEGEY